MIFIKFPDLARSLAPALLLLASAPCAVAMEDTEILLEQAEFALSTSDFDKALPLYETLAAEGNADAMLTLSIMSSNGWGMPANEDNAKTWALKAREIWERGAKDGNPWAYAALGNLYRNGRGVLPSAVTARRYFLRARRIARPAAEQGDARSQYILGRLYLDGLGVEQDTALSLQWFIQAGEGNVRKAQRTLAYLYRCNCRGITADPDKQRYWDNKLAANATSVLSPGPRAVQRLEPAPVMRDRATPIYPSR